MSLQTVELHTGEKIQVLASDNCAECGKAFHTCDITYTVDTLHYCSTDCMPEDKTCTAVSVYVSKDEPATPELEEAAFKKLEAMGVKKLEAYRRTEQPVENTPIDATVNKTRMRDDWRAIKIVYNQSELSVCRRWSEASLIDLVDFSRAYLEKNLDTLRSSAFNTVNGKYPGFFNRLPLCPCVLRFLVPTIENTFQVVSGFIEKYADETLLNICFVCENIPKPLLHFVIYKLDDGTMFTTKEYNDYLENQMASDSEFVKCVAKLTECYLNYANLFLEDLINAEEHMVEEVRELTTKQQKRAMKSSKHVPWTREDLVTVRLIKLEDAKRVGRRVNHGGTHASPRPHVRRGHFATLRHNRFKENIGKRVWVRQAWVGDREWVFNGSQYRVVDSRVVTEGDRP